MLTELKADLARYPGTGLARLFTALRCAAIYPIAVYRFGHDVYFRWPRPLSILAKLPYKFLALLTEWMTGIYIAADAAIGPGLYIGHYGCIRIGRQVRMGEHCNVAPMVILGFGVCGGRSGVPALGDRVYVGSGAKILGPVRVGDDVAIGANAVVVRDVPDHVTVGGVPAKIISRKGSTPYLTVGQRLDVAPGEQHPSNDIVDVVRATRSYNSERATKSKKESA